MEARHALRVCHHRSDSRHRQRRGVGRQRCARCHHRFEILEERSLEAQVFDDGLDHQVAIGKLLHRRHRMNPCDEGIACGFVEFPFFVQFLPLGDKRLLRARCCAIETVQHEHLASGLRRDLCNAPAHGAGADHADLGKIHAHLIIVSIGNFRL